MALGICKPTRRQNRMRNTSANGRLYFVLGSWLVLPRRSSMLRLGNHLVDEHPHVPNVGTLEFVQLGNGVEVRTGRVEVRTDRVEVRAEVDEMRKLSVSVVVVGWNVVWAVDDR